MKNTFCIWLTMGAALLVPVSGCGSRGASVSASPPQVDSITDPSVLDPATPIETIDSDRPDQGLSVKIHEESSMTPVQQQKLRSAVSALNQVMNSPELKDRILNFTYAGKKQFYENQGLSNAQVYQALMSAAEVFPLKTGANHVADLSIAVYSLPWWKVTNTVAFTAMDDTHVNIDSAYLDSASISELAKTLMHEWIHKLGFFHDDEATEGRPFSVPYGIGGLVGEAVQLYLSR